MPKEEENPLVRIAESLENITTLLEKMANPPQMVRLGESTFEIIEQGMKPGNIKVI